MTCPMPSSHSATPCSANFVRQHQNCQSRHWRPVLFTDESSFAESTNDRLAMVCRPRKKVTQTVTLSKLNGTKGAHDGLDGDTLVWSYRPVCVC